MTSFMEMKLKSFRKVKNQIMSAVGTLEILILLGYGADAPKKDFTPILEAPEVNKYVLKNLFRD